MKKIAHEKGMPDKVALYLPGIYEDDALQFLPHEEGRIRHIIHPDWKNEPIEVKPTGMLLDPNSIIILGQLLGSLKEYSG